MPEITKVQFLKFVNEKLWTSKELCEIFDKHVVTIIDWKKNKDLPFIALRDDSKHKAIFFIKEEVIAWAKENDVEYNLPEVKK